jgi:serine-type D-Ala-D-Ala carboxypeptidase/endopeptidase (penicillin-binding protein 4)
MRVRVFLAVVVTAASAAVATGSASPSSSAKGLVTELRQSLASPYLPPGRTAAMAVDLVTGAVVFAHNGATPVAPASNEKLPVAWTALTTLGPAYRFHTEVYGNGSQVGSTFEGSLVLKGFGDPTLSARDLRRLAARVYASGIRRVTGRVLGDESFYDMQRDVAGWKSSFLGIEAPPLSSLVVDRARGWPALSPPLLAARTFRDALVARGVVVDGRPGLGRARPTAVTIASDVSVRLAHIVPSMNRDSDNFTAEMMLKQLGAVAGTAGTSAAGATVVQRTMRAAGVSVAGVRIVDGSGLSQLDRLTAGTLVQVITTALGDQAIRRPFVESLAVAGRSGTLRRRLPSLAGVVRGKTGTTNTSSSLSGLVGMRYAFSVVHVGDPVSYWEARAAQDRFVSVLAAAG